VAQRVVTLLKKTFVFDYERCEIKENGVYEELTAVNLEKFDFIGFIFSKLDQFNREIRKSKSFKNKDEE